MPPRCAGRPPARQRCLTPSGRAPASQSAGCRLPRLLLDRDHPSQPPLGLGDRDPVGHRLHGGQGDRAARRQRCRVRRRPLGLDPDHPDVRASLLAARLLDRGGGAGHQAPAAERDQHRLDVRSLLHDLEPAGALPGHDVLVVVGVDQHGAGLGGEPHRLLQRLVEVGAVEDHLRAVPPGGVQLGDRGTLGHEHRGLDPEQLRGERDALRVVAGGRRDHAAGALLLGEPEHPHVGAADLERAGALEVLALEQHRAADDRRQPARVLHRGRDRHSLEEPAGLPDVVEGDVRHGRTHGRHTRGPTTAPARPVVPGRPRPPHGPSRPRRSPRRGAERPR